MVQERRSRSRIEPAVRVDSRCRGHPQRPGAAVGDDATQRVGTEDDDDPGHSMVHVGFERSEGLGGRRARGISDGRAQAWCPLDLVEPPDARDDVVGAETVQNQPL